MSTVTSRDAGAHPLPRASRRGPVPGWLLLAGWLAGCWIVPLATHAVHLDAVLPLIILAGLASIQRSARTWLDRLVIASVQLFGVLCVAGLVISVWPWGLHPVPIAGFALTGLVLLAAVTGRRPAPPVPMTGADRLTALAAAAVAVATFEPFVPRDLGGRIGLLAPGEDFARHFVLYDMIGNVGGYAFLHPAAADRLAPAGIPLSDYPQGTHLLYAVLDRFLRSASGSADGVTAMNMMIWLYVATFAFFALAVLWGLRRVAGPGAGAARLFAVLGPAGLYLFLGDPFAVFIRGYPNELVGLLLVAVLTAVVARPLVDAGEQILTLAALVVGISFCYHLFLPFAAVAVACWAWRDRAKVRRHRWPAVVAVLMVPAALVTPLLTIGQTAGAQLQLRGTALTTDRPLVVAWLVVAGLGLVSRGGLRSPARRLLAVEVATALATPGALLVYQYATVGRSAYYFEKTLHLLLVVLVVAAGSAARLLPGTAVPGPATRSARLRALAPGAATVLVATLVLAGLGGPWHSRPLASSGLRAALALEIGTPQGGRDAVRMARMYPDAGGATNVDLMHTPYANVFGTLFGSAMQRDYRHGHYWSGFLYPTRPWTRAGLERMVRDSDVPVRFLVQPRTDPDLLVAVQQLARAYPGRVQVVHVAPAPVR